MNLSSKKGGEIMAEEVKTQEEIDDAAYPAKDYKKSIYTFSKEQLAELKPLDDATKLVQTFMALGQIAQRAKDAYVGGQVLDTLNIKKSQDSKFNYDLDANKIIVYEPRLWCSQCDTKRAEFKYQDKIYCSSCIEEVKKTIAQPVEQPAVEEEPKKEKKTKLTK